MNDRPSTVKDAAARLILGEIAPLVEKVDQAAVMMKESHEHLSDDIRALAAIVTTLDKTISGASENFVYLTAQARSVQTAIARFENMPAPKASVAQSPALLGSLLVGSSLLAAALAIGAVKLLDGDTAEQARVGRTVSAAYKLLDRETQQKLDAAIQKTRN